jgi:glycosyltransferase involved in cell wall biosynthesis
MRIHFLVPHPEDEAPGQRLKFEQYYGRLRQAGFEVVHDAFYTPALYRRIARPGGVGKFLRLGWACVRRLRSLWTAWRSDVVYLFLEAVPVGPPVLEWVIARVLRRPIVYDIDDLIYLPKPASRNPLPTIFDRKRKVEYLMRAACHVVVCTPHLEKEARRLNERVTRISSTIDTDRYTPKTTYATARVTLGWSGSFSTSPYLHLLDDVLRTLQQRHGIAIRVIGDPAFGIPGVTLEAVPWRSRTEVADLLAIDVGLYPLPKHEWDLGKSGLKALQYMGLGIPTVLTPFGANLDIVAHEENGLFADKEADWVDALGRLILDVGLRERLGRAARRTVVDRYSVAVNWPLYEHAVHDALKAAGRAGV